MGKVLGVVLAVAGTGAVLVGAYVVGVPVDVVLGVGAGVVALLWLLVLLIVPWNLYFRAHTVLSEIAVSREKGLDVPEARDAEAARIARTMLRAAIGGHVATAGLVVAVTRATGNATGYWFAGFFLLSTLFRPAGAYFGQLRRRLGSLLKDVTYPRDDVVEVRAQVAQLLAGAAVLEGKAEEQYRALAELRRNVDALSASMYARTDATDHRITTLAREFEATVDRLGDNEEIITGLKAFLRLLRTDGVAAADVAGRAHP